MAGPFGMIAAHDIRDWAQRQEQCHDFYAHRKGFFRDAWWQMHCMVQLRNPPTFKIEPQVWNDPFYKFIERTWMLQQLPWAIMFYAIGGLPWVIWGIALRVTLSLHGHWLVGHFAHRTGRQNWVVDGVAVQGFNIPNVSLLTFGESHHGNHHAYPGSARLSQAKGELDTGWWLIKVFEVVGLAKAIKLPDDVGERAGLRANSQDRRYPKKVSLFAAWLTASAVGTMTFVAMLGTDSLGYGHAAAADLATIFQTVSLVALAVFALVVTPAIRMTLNSAAEDADKGIGYYVKIALALAIFTALSLSLLTGPAFPVTAILFAMLIMPSAISSGVVFGLLNQWTIRKSSPFEPGIAGTAEELASQSKAKWR